MASITSSSRPVLPRRRNLGLPGGDPGRELRDGGILPGVYAVHVSHAGTGITTGVVWGYAAAASLPSASLASALAVMAVKRGISSG